MIQAKNKHKKQGYKDVVQGYKKVIEEKEQAELKGLTKIIIAKNRSGATCCDKTIKFDDKTTYFYQGAE